MTHTRAEPLPVAFYVKCRPQNCDALKLALDRKIAFIGYPAWRADAERLWDRNRTSASIVDITQENWRTQVEALPGYLKQVAQNHNLASRITAGSLVVIPRPEAGLCYLGRVKDRLRLVDAPDWSDQYFELRRSQRQCCKSERHHIGDVVQVWDVERFEPVPLPLIPRWIFYRLLGRNTAGLIGDRPDGKQEALEVLTQLYEKTFTPDLFPTWDPEIIASRLLDWVTTSTFEHLMVNVLQLEEPERSWMHVGGSGDGGVDGIAMVGDRIEAVLQCKWKYDGDPVALGEALYERIHGQWHAPKQVYVATLFGSHSASTDRGSVRHIDREFVARLLIKHRKHCALAITLGVADC